MSKIMKACQSCCGRGRYGHELLGVHKCPRCDNGCVPDVEANLRAEIMRLTATVEDRDAEIEITRMAAGGVIDSLRAEITAARGELTERHLKIHDLSATLAKRDTELVDARNEMASLTGRLDRALRACHIVTYGDGGVSECADVVGELENSKRLDVLNKIMFE
jgi:hypothetical protein